MQASRIHGATAQDGIAAWLTKTVTCNDDPIAVHGYCVLATHDFWCPPLR
jgi:hypothetical protein